MKRAFITGITGQDGSYLAELLLANGYEVHGLVRRTSSIARPRIDHISGLVLHYGDVTDAHSVSYAVMDSMPDEAYNLAGQSHVQVSFKEPSHTADVVYGGTLNVLEALRRHAPNCRMYQAGSSEMFGSSPPPQSESTPFAPMSPYAVAKVAAHHLCRHYRDAHGMFVSNGISFNHESPRRGENFLTRKVTLGIKAIASGTSDHIRLGCLDAKRDWGYAPEFVNGMWRMIQADKPGDYVLATGESYSCRWFVDQAFRAAGLDPEGRIVQDHAYCRPADVPHLHGDASKIEAEIGWSSTTRGTDLVRKLVEAEMMESSWTHSVV